MCRVLHRPREASAERLPQQGPVVLRGDRDRKGDGTDRTGVDEAGPGREEASVAVSQEEQARVQRPPGEDVVVEVEIVLGQSLDVVQPGLDGVRVEGWGGVGGAEVRWG